MRKIKITEKQAKLLETLNSKKVLKVTKEQYNRIIESELNRPSLTETPELHEEEINEELFREFVNELYGLNEEGKELRFDKLNRVMEAAGLIEGGKLVKEKFGKDARRVKEVVGKGLMKYEECGSVYEAVELMEALTDAEGNAIKKSLQNQLAKQPLNPNRLSNEKIRSSAYKQTIDTLGYDPKEKLPDYPKGGGKYNTQRIKELLDPTQDSMELDEETISNENEIVKNEGEYSYEEMRTFLGNIKEYFAPFENQNSGPRITIPKDRNQGMYVYELEKNLLNEFDSFYNRFKGENPVFYIWTFEFSEQGLNEQVKKIRPYRFDINSLLHVASLNPGKLENIKVSFESNEQQDFAKMMSKGDFGSLDEFDSTMAGGSYEGQINQKPIYKSNVNSELTSKIYEALKKK